MSFAQSSFLNVDSVEIRYGDVIAVAAATFSVSKGEFVTLLGPSGSGKTSLLRAIAGFLRPARGSIVLDGEQLNDVRIFERDIGMVFQHYALFPHMTVARNVGFGLRMQRLTKTDIAEKVNRTLKLVRLEGFEERFPNQLSGGQQQRVALARAVILEPRLLLLDEPMSNLDALLRTAMQMELLEILGSVGITTISVTHNQEEALSMSDRVVVMARGHIQQIGSPIEVYIRPANEFVAGFVGQSNLFRCRILDRTANFVFGVADFGGAITFTQNHSANGELLILVRPESIDINLSPRPDINCFIGIVSQSMFVGASVIYHVNVQGKEFVVQQSAMPGRAAWDIGSTVTISWSPEAAVSLRT